MLVERLGAAVQIVAKVDQARGSRVPVRDSVDRCISYVEVGGRGSDVEKPVENPLLGASRSKSSFRECAEELQLLSVTTEDPCQTAGPR